MSVLWLYLLCGILAVLGFLRLMLPREDYSEAMAEILKPVLGPAASAVGWILARWIGQLLVLCVGFTIYLQYFHVHYFHVPVERTGITKAVTTAGGETFRDLNSVPPTLPTFVPNSTFSLSGQLLSQKDRRPVVSATVQVGGVVQITGEDGKFALYFTEPPPGDNVLNVRHEIYVSRLIRVDDPQLQAYQPVVLVAKPRLIVDTFKDQTNGEYSQGSPRTSQIRFALEGRLTRSREIQLLAEEQRNDVLKIIHQYQERRALHDQDSRPKAGYFLGATHGVLGRIRPEQGGRIKLEADLIELERDRKIVTAFIVLDPVKSLDDECNRLADQLLAGLCEARILSPKDSGRVPMDNSFSGYGQYLPPSWTIWISVLPEGTDRHYPQLMVTVGEDGTWLAPSVTIGERLENAGSFWAYVVLLDPRRTEEVQSYLQNVAQTGKNSGLALASWPEETRKILHKIRVSRRMDGAR